MIQRKLLHILLVVNFKEMNKMENTNVYNQ